MKRKNIFVACDTANINKARKIINCTKSKKLKIGYKFGLEFFYSDGDFTMNVPSGKAKILIERGTEYEPLYLDLIILYLCILLGQKNNLHC